MRTWGQGQAARQWSVPSCGLCRLGPEALRRACLGPCGLGTTVPGFCPCDETLNQGSRRCGHFFDRLLERCFVGARWHRESAQFPDELQCGVPDLQLGGGRLEIEEGLDAAAHCEGGFCNATYS